MQADQVQMKQPFETREALPYASPSPNTIVPRLHTQKGMLDRDRVTFYMPQSLHRYRVLGNKLRRELPRRVGTRDPLPLPTCAIRRDFGLSFLQLGSLATAFTVVLALGSLPLGLLADRTSRRAVIGAGVFFWSAATFLSGLATSFRSLFIARGMVGVGEAAYTPAGAAIISANFRREVRARVQGAFDAAMFAGGAVGIALGGVISQMFGWRSAFFVVGIPGLLLGITAFRLPEPKPEECRDRVSIQSLVRVPAYIMLLISGWFSSFAGYTYIAWGPQLVQEYKGFSPRESGILLGLTIIVAGLGGIMTGASFADHLSRKSSWGRATIIPLGFFIAAPLIYFAIGAETKWHFALLFGAGAFFLSWYHGPTTATIHDLIPAAGHATALGMYYMFVNLFSMALAPVLIGFLADRHGLLAALRVAVAVQVIGGILFVGVVVLIRRQNRRLSNEGTFVVTEVDAVPEVS